MKGSKITNITKRNILDKIYSLSLVFIYIGMGLMGTWIFSTYHQTVINVIISVYNFMTQGLLHASSTFLVFGISLLLTWLILDDE